MVYLPRPFKVFVDALREDLSAIEKAIQELKNAIRDAAEASNDEGGKRAGVIASAIETAAKDVPQYEKTQRNKEYGQQNRLYRVTFGAFVAAALYAAVAIWQGYLMRWTLKETQKATRATEEAAYDACISAKVAAENLYQMQIQNADIHNSAIGSAGQAAVTVRGEAAEMFVNKSVFPGLNPDHPIEVPMEVRNTGKSAAIRVHVEAVITVLKVGEEPTFGYPNPPKNWNDTGVVFPDDKPARFTYSAFDSDGSKHMLTPTEWDSFTRGESYVSFYGQITYLDIFGNHHWAHFCVHFDQGKNPDQFNRCAAYNQTDAVFLEKIEQPKAPAHPEAITCKVPTD